MSLSMDSGFVLFALTLLIAVALLLEGAWNLWASRHSPLARRLAQRLQSVSHPSGVPGNAAPMGAGGAQAHTQQGLSAWLSRTPLGRRLEAWLQAGAATTTAAQALACSAGGALLGALAAWLSPLAAWALVPAAFGGAALPWALFKARRDERCRRVEQQFPQALDLLARALRAGHALPAAVRMAAEELPAPLVRDFRLLFEEMNYGVAVPQALARFAARVPLPDASYFAVAVSLQRESGGNLAEVLDKIASLVRERLRLRGEIRTLSAEGRLSAVILASLPFAVAAVVQVVNPRFLSVLWTDAAGPRVVGLALAGIVVGVWWMRSIIRIRV